MDQQDARTAVIAVGSDRLLDFYCRPFGQELSRNTLGRAIGIYKARHETVASRDSRTVFHIDHS